MLTWLLVVLLVRACYAVEADTVMAVVLFSLVYCVKSLCYCGCCSVVAFAVMDAVRDAVSLLLRLCCCCIFCVVTLRLFGARSSTHILIPILRLLCVAFEL